MLTPGIIDWFLPVSLVLMMFGLGVSLTAQDFRRVVLYPRAAIAGLAGQLLILPLAAFGAGFLLADRPEMAMGLLIIAVCPGGAVSNIIAFALHANLALSVTLTAISSIVTMFTIPLLLSLGLRLFWHQGPEGGIELPVLSLFLKLAAISLLPIAAGILLRALRPGLADRIEAAARPVSVPFMAMIIIVVVGADVDFFLHEVVDAAPPVLAFLALMSAVGYGLSRLLRASVRDALTVMIEVAVQNTTLALYIAATLLHVESFVTVPATYGLMMFLIIGVVLVMQLRQSSDPDTETEET